MDIIYDQLVQDYGAVTFEAFINLLVRALSFPIVYELCCGRFLALTY